MISSTRQALGWAAEGKKFADANPATKGMGYGELIVDNIIGLDNEYESFGEQLGNAINEDAAGFFKDAAVGVYEGTKEFINNPIETTKEVVIDIKDSVKRLGSEDLSKRLQSMYGVSYDQATDQQVNSAREAVLGDAMTALGLIPAVKGVNMAAKAGIAAIPSGVKADVIGQTKAVLSGDTEFLRGTPTERSDTVGVGAQVVGQDDVSLDDINNYMDSEIQPTKSKKQTNPLVRSVDSSDVEFQADLADFRSSVLGSLDNLTIGKDGMSGFQIKKFLEKRAPKINKTELYWSGLLENLDDSKKYSKQELKILADKNVPYTFIKVLEGRNTRYRENQRIALNNNGLAAVPYDGYKEILITNKNTKGNQYDGSHFGGVLESDTNILAHVRGTIVYDGDPAFPIKERFFLVEELQSDAVQKNTVADEIISKKIKEEEAFKPTLSDIGLHYELEFNDIIFPYHMLGLDFTEKFVKNIDSYNYNFRSLQSAGDIDTAEDAVTLGLTNIIDDMAKLKSSFLDGAISKEKIVDQLSKKYGLKRNSIERRSIQELDEVDNILANVLSDHVFGKSDARKFNKENNNRLKRDLISVFEGLKIESSIQKDLVPAKLSDTIKMSLLAVIKESKKEGVNKIYIPTPKVMSIAHELNLEAAKNTYSDGVRKVLNILNSETNGKIKFKNGNPKNISYLDDANEIGIEIDITDFNLPDNPQFRFDEGGLAVNQTEQIMSMPTAGDPAIIDPTTGQPYDALGSMRQQKEMTRQAEATEEFNLLQDQKLSDVKDKVKVSTLLATPETEDTVEEITKDLNELKDPLGSIRPKARPEKKLQGAIKKIIELGYIQKRKVKSKNEEAILKSFDSTFRTVTNLTESKNLETITKFITQALGAEDPNLDVTKDGVYWCAAFVNHILTEMGADTLGKGDKYNRLRANKYVNYGKEISLENMQEGDILLFGRGDEVSHVGFYTGERSGNTVNMMGGNQYSGVNDEFDNPVYEVNSVPRNLNNIIGVRRVTYQGDAAKIVEGQKDDNSIFKYFDTDTYKASFTPSTSRKYNQGGEVNDMNRQTEMAFMQQGGLKDDGMKQDPVSGNQIPNGSMAKEVRDDIPAQLSEGEYVVPADVVRYLGVKHFEDLRNKAKNGLQSMEANGRIGGEPVPAGGPKAGPKPPQMPKPPMPPQMPMAQQQMKPPVPYGTPQPKQMAMGGDLTPEELNEINSLMMNQGGMVPSDPYAQQQAQYQQPMSRGAAEGSDFSTPTRYRGGFSDMTYNPQTYTPTPVVADVPGAGGASTAPVQVESPASCAARGMVYDQNTRMCRMPSQDEDSNDFSEKKRLQDMVDEHQQGSQVTIANMSKEQLLEAYQGAEMGKYVSSGLMALNPVVGGIARLFAGNESKKIQARLKELGVTNLPEVEYKKGGIIGSLLGGANNLGEFFDNTIFSFQQGKINAGTSTYKAQFNPPNSAEYSNNLQQSVGSIWGSEQEAYDAAVRNGDVGIANHFEAINRLRGKQNNFYDSTKGMTKIEAYAQGRRDGLSVHDMDQAFKYGGSLGRAISSGVVEKEGFFNKYEFKDGKTVSDVETGTTPAIVPSASAYTPTVPSGGPGTFNVSDNDDNDGPSAAQISAARVEGDKISEKQTQKIIDSGNTYSTDTSTAIEQMKDRGTFNVGGRATGGLVSRPKKKKK